MTSVFRRRPNSAVVCHYLTFNDPVLKRPFRLPMAHVRVKQGEKSFRTDALIDSGATTTFIPIELVNILGFGLKPEGQDQTEEDKKNYPKHQAVGAGGVFDTYHVTIESIQVLKGTTSFFEMNNSVVAVPTTVGAIHYAVLGRDGIFKKYDIIFREKEEHVVFRRN